MHNFVECIGNIFLQRQRKLQGSVSFFASDIDKETIQKFKIWKKII